MLDSTATKKIKTRQYYDGLGRPSELAVGGINPNGCYLYTLQTYDDVGREDALTLPVKGSTALCYNDLSLSSSILSTTYNDNHAYSRTTYDVLNRPTFVTTPGDNWVGKGRTITYVTNGSNEVKRYNAGVASAQQNGYYPAGSLTGEVVTDEDGIAVTTFKDLAGRVILERRGDNDDVYYVYSNNGNLRYVLQPMYQESPTSEYQFRNSFDVNGRMTYKYHPGCNSIKYWYDGANRVIAMREPVRGPRVCTRHFFYDGLGRLVVQGRALSTLSNASAPVIVSRTATAGTAEIGHTGYYVDAARLPQNLRLEIVNYYDDYAFLSSDIFNDSIPSGNFQTTSSACTSTLKTGDITATSDGHLLARVYYYDDKGRVIDTRENLLGGEFLQTTTSYSFTGKPLNVHKMLSSGGNSFPVTETFTYDTSTDRLIYDDISYDNNQHRASAYTYDDLGRLTQEMAADGRYGIIRSYNLHGWLTSVDITNLTSWQKEFVQDIYYETGNGQPCYNGNISSMRWKTGSNSYGSGYKFRYDLRNRLTQANHTLFNMSDYPITYTERIAYNRNSAPTSLTRFGGTTGMVLDSLSYTYNGNQVQSILDVSSHSISNGLFEFVDGANQQTEYSYNNAGDLLYDANKGIASIKYDHIGHPIRVQFTNGNLIEYVYAADGRKLRERHTTAVSGLTVNLGSTLALTPATTLAVDSLDYADNLRIRNQQFSQVGIRPKVDYYYAGGFMSLTPSAVGYPITVIYDLSFHSFLRDHQGNVRVVADGSGNEEQLNDYYPYGCPYGDTSTNQGFQPYKYNGKELDRVHGLDWYDYGARRYDPAYCLFTQIDPLAEQYPHLNPYVYCAGNPVNYVDPDGMDWVYVSYGSDMFYFYDNRVKSQEDIIKYYYGGSSKDNRIQYYGRAGSVKNENGELLYTLNNNGTFSDTNGKILSKEVDQDGYHIGNNALLGKVISPDNWYGFYLGPNNPILSDNGYSYSLPPVNDLDYAAFLHDRGYDQKGAVGINGALLNSDVASDDFKLALRSYASSLGTMPLSKKYIVSLGTAYTFGSLALLKYCLRRFKK